MIIFDGNTRLPVLSVEFFGTLVSGTGPFEWERSSVPVTGGYRCWNCTAPNTWISPGISKARMAYFEKDDVLHLAISDEPEAGSVEISPNITAKLNAKDELIGIEILSASTFIRDSVLDSIQARVLDLAQAKTV